MSTPVRPYVILQMAASVDGRIAFGPNLTMFDRHPAESLLPDQTSLWKRVEEAIETERQPQATMMGSGTILREGVALKSLPEYTGEPTALGTDFLPDDVVRNTQHWAVLVDGRGRCRSGYKATENPGHHILHLVSRSAPAEYLAFLREARIPYFIGGERHADLSTALTKLASRLGIRAIRLWGGGTLNGAMLRLRLVDELHVILQPVVIGGSATPTLFDCEDLHPGEAPTVLQLTSAQPESTGYVWLRYQVVNGRHAPP